MKAAINEKVYGKLLMRLLPRPIETEEQNERAIQLLEQLDIREDLTPEEEALAELLTILIEHFEEKHYSMKPEV